MGLRHYAPMFPAFLGMKVDEIHVEMASREFAELEILATIARRKDVAVGIVDVKSYYIETVEDVAERVRACLRNAPADRLAFAPDCGLSQTARWAARQKLRNLVAGVAQVAAHPARGGEALAAGHRRHPMQGRRGIADHAAGGQLEGLLAGGVLDDQLAAVVGLRIGEEQRERHVRSHALDQGVVDVRTVGMTGPVA